MIVHCRFLELDSKSSGETFGHTSDYKSNDGLFSVWFLNRKLFPLSACRHAVCGSVGLFRISDRKKKDLPSTLTRFTCCFNVLIISGITCFLVKMAEQSPLFGA